MAMVRRYKAGERGCCIGEPLSWENSVLRVL